MLFLTEMSVINDSTLRFKDLYAIYYCRMKIWEYELWSKRKIAKYCSPHQLWQVSLGSHCKVKSKIFSDSHKTFVESTPGPARQNKLEKQSATVRDSFWCQSGKNTAHSMVLIRETLSTATSYMNCKSLRHSSSALKSPKTPHSNLLRNLHLCPCSFQVIPQETLNQSMFGVFFSFYKPQCGEANCLGTCTPTSTHTSHPCSRHPYPQTHPVGRAENECCQAHSRKRGLRQSALSAWALICALPNATRQRALWNWGPLPMHCLLLTCFKNTSTMHLLFSIHYIIAWYISKQLLLNE